MAPRRILIHPPSPRSIPSPHDGEVGQGGGISKERDNSMEPVPLTARASQGEGAGDFSDGGCIKMRPGRQTILVGRLLAACQKTPEVGSRRGNEADFSSELASLFRLLTSAATSLTGC